MPSISNQYTHKRDDGRIMSEQVVGMSDSGGSATLNASDLGLNAIENVFATPNEGDFVVGGASVDNRGSLENSVAFTLYAQAGGTLNAAGSATYHVRALGQ